MLKFLMLLILPQLVVANTWQDLWLNKNQQGSHLLKQNKNDEAAKNFTDKNWKGIAYYREGKYQEAYNEFKQDNSARGLYNQGNALAHMQKYQEAIYAYTKSLELQKSFPDATYNKELVEKLFKQQQQQNKQEQMQSDKDKPQQNSDNKQSEDKQNSSEANKQNKQQNPEQQSSSQNKQQQNTANGQQDNTKQQSGTKNQQQNSAANQETNPAQTKPEQNTQQQTNTGMSKNSLEQKQQDNLNKQQTTAQNKLEQNSDKTADEQSPAANYMRPQTPVDVEVKSALSQIPDDPGGLLRNKFLRDYQNQKQDGNNE